MNPRLPLFFCILILCPSLIFAQDDSVRWEKPPSEIQYQPEYLKLKPKPEYLDIQDYPNDPAYSIWITLPNGSLRQPKTGLIWQAKDDGKRRNWNEAIRHCENLKAHGKSDWRLPNRDELNSLLEKEKRNGLHANPILNLRKSSGGYSWYWSATTGAGDGGRAWGVNFGSGGGYWSGKAGSYYVRCISRP